MVVSVLYGLMSLIENKIQKKYNKYSDLGLSHAIDELLISFVGPLNTDLSILVGLSNFSILV